VATEGTLVFLLTLGIYLVIAILLDFKYHSFLGDAFSRMANGFYILYSRDRHLAAVGFVWEPLPSVAAMFFLLGNHFWTALSHNNFAGSLTSAFSMAGAVYQLRAALREWGIARAPRLVLTALFALDPMILLYSGNGMSEGLYLFTLIAAVRYLLRWLHAGDLRSLAYSAIALGFSYLTRNEAAAGVIAGGIAVALVSFSRAKGGRWPRAQSAIADSTIFVIPGVLAATGWAVISYVITGSFFGQYSSLYGSSEQEANLTHESLHARILYEFHAILSMWPLIPLVLVAAIVLATRRRDPRILAPISVLGGALGFDMLALLNNNIQPYYRYYIVTIPIEVFLVGSLIAPNPNLTRTTPRGARQRPSLGAGRRALRDLASIFLTLALLIPAVVTTAAAMFNPNIGSEELQQLAFIFEKHPNAVDALFQYRYAAIVNISTYLDNLHLPNGDIIVDNSADCMPEIIVTSNQPRLYVIPNNRDFQRELADPLTFHSHFILEPDPATFPITAMNIQYPSLWTTGDGFAKDVHKFPSRGTCPAFRLFKVFEHPNQAQ
jgi:hypothetical protein